MTILPNASSGQAPTTATSSGRQSKKPHTKSRDGCYNCKRRKVKCDERRPECHNCTRFQLPCSFTGINRGGTVVAPALPAAKPGLLLGHRRGRGRPRKDWAAGQLHINSASASASASTANPAARALSDLTPAATTAAVPSPPPAGQSSPLPHPTPPASLSNFPICLIQAELLHYFITNTGPELSGSTDHNHPIAQFWSRNATLIGLENPYVLNLILALAAYHLAYLAPKNGDNNSRSRYLTWAEHYNSTGLAELNEALSSVNSQNCGALYASTMLICYCSFAAGPSCSGDVLVCDIVSTTPSRWLPLARGTRLLRELYEPDVLFSGLLEPLGGTDSNITEDDLRPTCIREGFTRLDWVEPLAKVWRLVASSTIQEAGCKDRATIYARSLHDLAAIYEATFGNDDGHVTCPHHYNMVLIWLYMMEDEFVQCLQRLDSIALLLLAYYAPLLKSMRRCWFMERWAEQLISVIKPLMTGVLVEMLEWPAKAIRLL